MYGFGHGNSLNYQIVNYNGMWLFVISILSISLAIILFLTFLKKENSKKFTGFLGKLYDFLNFNVIVLRDILKIAYLASAIYVILLGFSLITINFFAALALVIVGNIIIRIIYKFLLLFFNISNNVSEINKKMLNHEKNNKKIKNDLGD